MLVCGACQAAGQSDGLACTQGDMEFGHQCWHLAAGKMSFPAAQSYCKTRNMQLPGMNSQANALMNSELFGNSIPQTHLMRQEKCSYLDTGCNAVWAAEMQAGQNVIIMLPGIDFVKPSPKAEFWVLCKGNR